MIYDTFLFNNELELLKCRLAELSPVVDKFVLAEAEEDHRGHPKPLFFYENKEYFRQWKEKIEWVNIGKFGLDGDNVDVNGQREHLARRALDAYPFEAGSTIIYGDADEIVRPQVILNLNNTPTLSWCQMRMYHFFYNCLEHPTPHGARPVIGPRYFFKEHGFESARWHYGYGLQPKVQMIPDGGWHFSYLGGVKDLKAKIYGAVEGQCSDWVHKLGDAEIQRRIDAGRQYDDSRAFQFVPVDESFPQYVRDNEAELRAKGYVK